MSEPKLTQKVILGQESIDSKGKSIVGWDIFDTVWHENYELREKLRFLLTNSNLDADWGLNIIFDLIDLSEKNAGILWEKAKTEKHGAGGNGVATEKPKSIFDDGRFWEYVIQIRLDGHNPVDILEAWLKEHNPEHFEEETAT
jgi:hypothetical protein